jgi:cytochrome c peroxidase
MDDGFDGEPMLAARHCVAHALTLVLAATACGSPSGPHAAQEPEIDAGGSRGGAGPEQDDAGSVPQGDLPELPWAFAPVPLPPEPQDNPATAAKTALGRLLFYDPIVSVDHQVACATCHSEAWGMGDGLAVSFGHGAGLLAGPGRNGPHRTRRNSPTLWNVAFRATQFWDGRAASLEDQVHFPFESKDEFDRPIADAVADVRAIPKYVALFRAAFPDDAEPITEARFAEAIAAFERTIVSKRGLYDAYAMGDRSAMTESMVRGMFLFAEVGCPSCHAPPLFSSDRFEDRGVAPIPGVDDAGRFETTGEEADRNRFQVPTLRNLHDTPPFFHTGAAASVADAVKHEAAESVTRNGARPLDAREMQDITAFLRDALFDSKNPPSRPKEVPSGLPVPIDGTSVLR